MFEYTENFQPGKLNATLNMKVNLAEIWDYHLEFMDWKTTNIQNQLSQEKKSLNPYIVISLDSPQAIMNQVQSKDIKNTILPYWPKIDQGSKGITFRGTYHELKSQELTVSLYSKEGLRDYPIGEKIIPLRDVIDVSFAKTDMVIHKKEGFSQDIENDEDLYKQA